MARKTMSVFWLKSPVSKNFFDFYKKTLELLMDIYDTIGTSLVV